MPSTPAIGLNFDSYKIMYLSRTCTKSRPSAPTETMHLSSNENFAARTPPPYASCYLITKYFSGLVMLSRRISPLVNAIMVKSPWVDVYKTLVM